MIAAVEGFARNDATLRHVLGGIILACKGPEQFGGILAQDFAALDRTDPKRARMAMTMLEVLGKLADDINPENKTTRDPLSLSMHRTMAGFLDRMGGPDAFADEIAGIFCGDEPLEAGTSGRVATVLGVLEKMSRYSEGEIDDCGLPLDELLQMEDDA